MGKTLAFAVPVIEKLLAAGSGSLKPGRKPRVLVMAPTRELAKQVRCAVGVSVAVDGGVATIASGVVVVVVLLLLLLLFLLLLLLYRAFPFVFSLWSAFVLPLFWFCS